MRNLLTRLPRTPLFLAILCFALYLPGMGWGVPDSTAAPDRVRSWGVDDLTPLGPLAEIHGILVPKPDRNLGYPLMHSFTVSLAYTPYLAYLWVTDQFNTISAGYPYGLMDPVSTLQVLALIARLVSVLMAVGIVVAAYDAARTLWDHRTGILTAVLVMVSFPMFYYSRTGNVDVPVLFFTALALAAFARSIARGFTLGRAVWLGIFVGFALGTKEPSFASFLPIPFVLLSLHWRDIRATKKGVSWGFWQASLTALLAAFLAFGVGSGLFVDPERYFAHVEFAVQRVHDAGSGQLAFVEVLPRTMEGNLQLAKLMARYLADTMTLPGLLLSGLGLVWVLRREPRASTFALPAVTYLIVLFWFGRVAQLRYVMPVAFTLTFFAAWAVVHAWKSRWVALRIGFTLVAFAIIGISFLRGVDLTHAMIKDSRYAAATWLGVHAEPGDLVEYFGPADRLPSLKPGVKSALATTFFGVFRRARPDKEVVQDIEERWKERKPKFVIIMPDYTSPAGVPHSVSCPPAIYENLVDGTLGYRQVAYFETPPLLPWVRRPALDYPSVNPPIRIFVRVMQPVGRT